MMTDYDKLKMEQPPMTVDQRELYELRHLKSIHERDVELLKKQTQDLMRDKDNLIDDLDGKLLEIQNMYNEKKDLLSQNFKLVEEVQNMRFMIQEKESQIVRLNF